MCGELKYNYEVALTDDGQNASERTQADVLDGVRIIVILVVAANTLLAVQLLEETGDGKFVARDQKI